jgi:ureidoglycolate dehydrogenase (NAD+)
MNEVNNRVGAEGLYLVSPLKLYRFVQNVLVSVGVPREDASIVADCLVTANLSGIDSHGVVRLAHYVRRLQNGTITTQPQIKFEKKGPSLGILDGDHGLGHVVTYHACTEAMKLAAENGTGAVVVKNSSHFGMAGFYVKRVVSEGYATMIMSATDTLLIPFGARKPFFGTNPVAIGFPTNGIPLILDMATTSIPYGKVVLAKTEGKPIPPDWGFDEDGNPTTEPEEIVGLHPIAGPKGSGLAMIIDILCSILSGMPFGPHINKMYTEMDEPRRLGHFITVWDIKRFIPLDRFKARLGQMIAEMNALPPAEGFSQVRYPGQIEGERRQLRETQGIPIDPGLRDELERIARQFNLAFPG